ncbi:zinc-binding dehydrogenase [bacterium]|nr:zinc-binding dehydrogenase [bacterium]
MTSSINVKTVFPGPNEVALREDELPAAPPPHAVRLRTHYSLISPGTELALLTQTHIGFSKPETHPWVKYPLYPGYAAVGEVEAVGADVTAFAPGDLVFYMGKHELYADVDPRETPVLPIPSTARIDHLPFARLAQIANSACYVADVFAGHRVAVIGLGLVGNLAAQICRRHGAEVIAVDLSQARRDIAARCGIVHAVEAERADAVAAVKAWSNGGADVVIEATGNPALVTPALQMVRPRGQVILLGSSRGAAEIDVYTLIHRPGVIVRGAHETVLPLIAEDGLDRRTVLTQMLDWIAQGHLIIEPLHTHTSLPQELTQAYHVLNTDKDHALGVLVDWRTLAEG